MKKIYEFLKKTLSLVAVIVLCCMTFHSKANAELTMTLKGCHDAMICAMGIETEELGFQIWNWADLAYLEVMMREAGRAEWISYGSKATVMQNIGVPGQGNYGNGYGDGVVKSPYYGIDDRQYGWYGYEGYLGNGNLDDDTELEFAGNVIPAVGSAVAGWTTEGWSPIGVEIDDYVDDAFSGEFEGQGFEISGLWHNNNRKYSDYVGLFAVTYEAVIKNIGVKLHDSRGINVSGNATGIGAIIGFAVHTEITGSYAIGNIITKDGFGVGGLVGMIQGRSKITDCYAMGTIDSQSDAAGLVGNVDGYFKKHTYVLEIGNSYAISTVSGEDWGWGIGGLAGTVSDASIYNCYAVSEILRAEHGGGLVGLVNDVTTITNSYATGNVTANDAGGLVGDFYADESTIENCYATGGITGFYAAGGLVGAVSASPTSFITNSYAFNPSISGVNQAASTGRIVGIDKSNSISLEYNYAWEKIAVTVNGLVEEISNGTHDNKNGEDIETGDALDTDATHYIGNGWNFDSPNGTWTFDYMGYNVETAIGSETNLPILQFTKTGYQPPRLQPTTIAVDLTVFLEGPMPATGTAEMTTHLQLCSSNVCAFTTSRLPEEDPYGLHTTYSGIKNPAGAVGAVVDWIKVEIWDASTMNTLPKTRTILEEQALLLKPNGKIVDITGAIPQFKPQAGAVRIVIRHRNHMSVMSNVIADFTTGTIPYDFTQAGQAYRQYTAADPDPVTLKNGKYCMWAGDFNDDGIVDVDDRYIILVDLMRGVIDDYLDTDLNMDGYIDTDDRQIMEKNLMEGALSPVFYFE